MKTEDTPRTNEAVAEVDEGYNGINYYVSPEFARELERELNDARAVIAHQEKLIQDAKADKARLDWLDGDSSSEDRIASAHVEYYAAPQSSTFREAIDAARKSAK